jgi:glutamate formiminotransferase/formiminotetrahydrofolate cyclodeaminase
VEPTRYADLTLAQFEEQLASAAPVPGGGSASAIAGSMAASLLAMVSRLSTVRPKYADFAPTHAQALAVAEGARPRLIQLADEDATAFAAFAAARKMPRETEFEQQQRQAATEAAARQASDIPLAVVRESLAVLVAVEAMAGRSNLNASSDLEVAARLAGAAARGAAANVMINLPSVGDDRYAGVTRLEVTELLEDVDRLTAQVAQTVAGGTLREPEA